MFDRGHEFSAHSIDQGRLSSFRVATQILGQPPNRQRGDSTGKVLPAMTNGLKAAVASWGRDGDPAAAAPSVQRGFELEPGFSFAFSLSSAWRRRSRRNSWPAVGY